MSTSWRRAEGLAAGEKWIDGKPLLVHLFPRYKASRPKLKAFRRAAGFNELKITLVS